MTLCEILSSVAIGLGTGAFSSWGVSKFFQKKEDKRAYERYKRELHQFLLQLFDELVLIERGGDCHALLEKLGRTPNNEWEGRYAECDQALVVEISDLMEELRMFGFSHAAESGEGFSNDLELNEWENLIPSLANKVLRMEYPQKKQKKRLPKKK